MAEEEKVETAAPAEGLMLAEQVAALAERVKALEDAMSGIGMGTRVSVYSALDEAFERINKLEGATPIEVDNEIKTLVSKLHDKMKLLIPMD